MAEDKRRLLYDQLTKDNYDLGDFQSFSENLNDSVKRRSLYDAITKDNYDVGDYESFSKALDNARTEPARQNQTANKPEVDVSSGVQQSNTNDFLDRLREINSNGNLGIPIVPQVGQSRNGDELLSNIQGNVDEFEKGLYDRIEEERNIDKTFKPSPVNNQGDIYRNYASRFSNTERGKQLGDELASIQQEVSRKYADQYLQSPEYSQLASQYSGDELDKRANEQFDELYGKRIQDDIEPYQRAYSNEVMSRYGSNIEKESNELVKKQVRKQLDELSGKVENMITLRGQQLEKDSEGKWWRDLPRGGGGSVTTTNFASNLGRNFDPEYQQLQAASSLIDNSKDIINEASKKGKTNFVAGIGRGIRDSFNADNWSFGLTELSKNINLNQVLDKADKGEQLSESEQALLDALVTNLAVNAYYSSDLGRGYKAGQTTGASIPFMLEFAVNPVSALGSGIAKGILRYGARRFGLASVRGAARKAVLTGARLAGDAAAAAAMTGSTGLAGVASDTQERMRGDVNIDFDENGNAVYKNRENQKGFAESAFKSATSRFLENQSEMVFNAFPGIGEAIGKAIPGGMPDMLKRFGNTRMGQSVRDLYREMKSNPTLREIAQRTQFHGLGEEYMEEVYNNFASIPLGDMTFEDAVSLDNNIDTFLGLAPTSVAFGMLGLAGMARERYNHRRNMRRVFGKFTPEQQRMFNELQQMSRENGNEDIKNFIKMTIEDPGLTQEQKRDEIQYAWEIARSNAIDDIQEEETQEQVDAENADIDAHTDPKTGMYTEMDRIVINDVGEEVRVPGHKTGEIGGMPVWVEEGKEVTPENSIVLKPGQWDEGTVRSMPADEVKAENEAMIREEAAAQAEQENTYSPDIPPLQLGSAFTDGNDTYEVVQQNADGGWIAKKTSVDEKGNQKEEVVPIDEKTYMDIMQANIEAAEEAREQANRPKTEITLNKDVINSATPKDYMKANPSIVEGYITSHPEQVQIRLNDEVRKTADYLNGKTDEKGYLSSMGYLDSYLNNASDEEIRELAKEQSDRYRPYLNINNQNQQSDDNAINLSENNAKNEASSSAGQSNVSESPVQVQQSEVQPEPIQQPQSQQEEQPKTEVQDTVIPTDEEGNPLYYRAPVEVTARSISGEGLEPEEVDAFIEANQREADKNLKKIQDKAPKMGTSIAAYKKAKAEWQEKVADAQAQSDYWKQVKEEITSIRTLPGDTTAEEIMRLGEPLNGEELASMMLGNGSLPLLRESYMKELGAGNKEAQGMFGLFASKENGGMTIEEAGEKLMEADRESGTHFFDQNDPNAGRNAIIDVLSSARTKGDLARFIQNNRERMDEQERQAEYAAYEDWCESYMHMTVPEYKAYQDYIMENNPYDVVDAAELDRIFAEAEQEYQIYLNESENGQGTTERGSGGLRGTPERDEQGGEAGVREEGVPVLSGEQPVLQGQVQGRAGGTEERPGEDDDVIRGADGNVSENEEGSIDNAIEQQDGENLLDFAGRVVKNKEIDDARRQVESNPTDAQKEAGNYKKGHIKLDGYDITIENPKGSVRSGVDENGQPWSVTMNNDYGYIRGTEGVDGDHIDVFLSDSPTLGDVYVIDQVDPDTGEFDEHKVMYGFKSALAAKRAYLANYSPGWKGLGAITKVSKEEFKKWVESSHRKTKPFAEYKSVNKENVTNESNVPEVGFEITPAQYTTKRGKVLDMFLVKFAESLTKEQQRAAKELARAERGWYDRNKDGFMMRSEESAQKLANTVMGDEETVNDAQPLSLADMQQGSEPAMRQVDVEGLMQAINRDGEAKLSDHFVVGRPGLTEKATSRQSNSTTQETDQQPAQEENQYGASNKLVSRDRYEELKKRMRQKLGGQLNMGIDPEILAIGTEMAAYHIEAGARKFADYATHMIADLGDAIRPYLKSFYNGARDLPEMQEAGLSNEMTPYEEVRMFDVANFDKGHSDALATAEMVVQEQEADRQADEAKEKLKSKRNEQKRKERPKKQDESKIADLFSAQEENAVENQENSPFKKGDAVVYKGKPATVYDIEDNGRLVLDTGLAPVLYESADPKEVKPANTATHNAGNTEVNRIFANAVKTDMLAALDSGTKPYRSILDLRKRAAALGMEVDNDGRTDILLQELVEDGLVRAAREVVEQHGRDSRESYDLICKLYEMQPTIAARSSNRIKMQQYSTPLPMAWNATRFAMSGKKGGKVLEPTAGNGMLVFAVPANQVHVNELDETRLDNLREQGFAQVTQQDATEPFEGGQQYDVIIANPPFGKSDEVEYDGKMIPGLDPQITLNALASMKDDGRAAIIIGGNMEYASNGGLKSMKPFFTYLYDHYNVKGVVDMDGSLYAKQGTTYPTRMILIDGRRSEEERAQSAVYPPVQSKAIRKADSFEALYDIIDEVINSKDKTNGTEILRSQQGQLISVADQPSRNADGKRHTEQPRKDDTGRPGGRTSVEGTQEQGEVVLRREHRTDTGNGEARRGAGGNTEGGSRRVSEPDVQRVERVGVSTERVGLEPQRTAEQPKKRGLSEEKLPYRPHNSAFSLQSVAPAAMVEAMDRTLTQIEKKYGNIDEFVRKELGYDTTDELHQALAAEQVDSVAMAIYQMKQGQALIIGDQTGVGKGRQMAALIRWAVRQGEKPIFITQKADLFSDIYRDLVDIGSGDLVPFIFNSPSAKENKGEMVDANGKVVYKGLSDAKMKKVLATGKLPDECDYAVLTYSQVNTGDEVSQKEMEEAAKKNKTRSKKSKSAKDGKATPKATFLRSIAEDNYLFLDESHTAAGSSNTGAYLQSILRSAKAATFASATFAKRPDTMPLYAIRTAMSQAKVEPDKLISIIEKGGVTLQEIMSRELTNAGQMVRRERDMSDVVTDWKTINDPETVRRARENYDRTIAAFNAIIKFQEDYVKPMVDAMDKELAVMAESAGIKRGTDKLGVENVPFASKTYNYTKQLMLALKVDAIANEVDAEIKAGRHPVIALESTMESSIKDYSAGEVISEPTFSASLLRGLDTVMQYTVKDENGKEQHARYSPKQLGPAGEKAYYELQDFIRESTSDIFISPLDAIIERLHDMGYKVGELTGRNLYVERDNEGRVIVKRRTDKDKKRMQREFNSGELDVLILNKSASTGISLHASEKFSDQRQRTMIIAQPLSDINDYMQMIGRIDRTGQVHRGYYINLGLPVPAENRFLMMLSTKLKSLNANTTTSQDSESNEVEAPDLLNKYGSQVVVEYLRDNPDIYEKMGSPLKKGGENGGRVQTGELDEYKPQEDDARKITGYVALLTTQEQEEFYDDVVRRYNELIKYLNDTGNNDLKITVMPLRAKTLEKRVSSEGIDPTGANPFAQNSYVEQVEMDVLRKPMKADEIRKTIEQVNKGKSPEDYIRQVISTIEKEDEARIAAEEARYERSKVRAQEDIAKQTEKINRQQKRSAEEKQAAIADYVKETNENVEAKHRDNLVLLNTNSDMLKQRLHMFEVGKSYLMPDNLESMVFDFSTPAIFCGYKAKDSKITASTTLAVFATLDGRRRMEIKLSQPEALRSIYKTTNDNWDAARSTTLENWDSQIPTGTRKTGFIMTGNILQAIADTQDEHGGYPGQLISYTDIDGNVHDGILMPDKWNTSMLKTSGAPIISRLKQIKDYMPVTSHDGKVELTGSSWAKLYYLTVPKTKKDGAVYYENKALLRAVNGSNFYPYRGKLRADIPEENIERVVRELSKLGVKVKEETNEDDALYRLDDYTTNEEEANDLFRVVDDASEITRLNSEPTVKVYRAMSLVDGKLYPPMSKKIGTGSNRISQAPSEFGQWEVSDERPELVEKEGTHKNHIYIVKDNGKGLWVAYNPYFHTSRNPLNDQFAEAYQRPNLVTVEVEVPESELTSGYQAEGAKDPVGETKWNAGPVNRQLSGDKKRKVILSRWMRPVRIVPDSEVAQRIAELIEGENVAIPDNTVTPSLLEELKKLGVKIVDGISKGRKKATAMMRGGNGALTDNELSYENDPVAKMTGRSTRTAAQRRAFAERERQRMVNAVQKLAETLHLDNVDIVTDASTLQGKRAKAKGFYSRGTGRITIVIPNHTSVYDVEQTLLHEAVAHYGLRQLFGEHFDTFLDNVYRNAEPEVRKKIVELAQKKGWNIATATEEYLASLAEDTNFDDISASWWSKIKELFLRMLHEIGFENFSGVTLSDNELRYILWRSYENLAEPGRYRSILGEAADIVKQNELKVGNYAEGAPTEQNAAESGDDLYRMAPDGETDDGSREAYNRAMTGNRFKAQEAYQDSMLSLKRLQEVVEKYSGKKLQSFENAYMAENQMSSKNTREKEVYGEKFFKPMIKSVGELMKKGASYGGIIDYMIARHGLERNEAFAYRDAELQTERRFSDKYKELEKMNDSGLLTDEEYQNRKDKLDSDKESYYQERVEKNLEKDYSGLTALADKHGVDEEEFKKHAEDVVADFESRFDASDLWDKVNSATKETLRKAYESGMMGRDVYNKVRGQFKYYIPLRGWDETTAEDVYEYLNSETSPVNSVLKSAKGRKSLADDPFATIGNMAESTIHQGNRNLMKQNFLNMAINHPTDVLTVKEAWYVKDTETGDWKMSFPDIKAGDSADVIADKIEEHEQRMKELEKNGESTKVKGGLNIDYRIGARQAREHIVTIKRNGKDYLVFVNGNPRAAQAVNGLTNPDADENKLLAGISRLNRELAANFTNRNPAFVLSNLARDLIFSVSAVSIKESPEYSRKFAKNIIRSMRVIARNLRGKGDPQHNQDDALFEEFLANGGETGYTMMHSVDEYKKMVKRELGKKEITGKTDYFSAVRACAQFFSTMNRWAEDVSRFTAYMTSKESGRPVMQSVNDAKEITVNFNRRGAGSKTSGVFGWTSGMFRNLYLFFNAGIQSLSNFGRLAKKNPKAFTTALAGFTAAGFIVPVLNGLFISLLGDGDDDYYGNLPDWVRKNNLCLFIPGTKGKFITIPLPIELRAFYGLGEMAYQETIGKEGSSGGQIAYKAINQITELLPLNPLGNNGDIAATIMPDVLSPIWQAYDNKDFTGKPVYRENAFNENMPEWTKAYNSTADWLVDLSEWTNEIAGGDKYKRGELLMSNWNPAIVEHLFESYFGGMAKTFNQTAKTLVGGVESAVKGEWSDELQWYSTPVLNRFINDASDDRSSFGKVNQRYYKLYEQFEETGKLIRGYSNEVSKGNLDYLEKLDGLYRSDDYKTYLVFKRGKRLVDRIREMEKSLPEGDSKERKALQEQSVKIKRSLIDAVEDVAGD